MTYILESHLQSLAQHEGGQVAVHVIEIGQAQEGLRTGLAASDAQRFARLSRRLDLRPPTMASSAGPSSRLRTSRGASAGSFWPSPSRVTITGARAA